MMSDRSHHILQPRLGDAKLSSGVRLHYAEQGDPTGPAVILLHGVTDSSFSWSRVLPLLPPDYRVFALDQRGHGDSDRPEQGYAIDDFAADVLAFMDAVGLPTATLVGHSMGSFIAQRAASTAPHRVERLVLVGTAPSHFAVMDELNEAAQGLTDPVPAEFVREFQASTLQRPVPEAFFERVVAETLKLPARVWQATIAGWFAEQRWGDPSRLRMPVLLIWGDRDALMSRDDQGRLLAELPNATLTVYAGTGHTPHWEEPERFARDLEGFIRASASTPAK
jgi:non-heme chloroperoxidase